MDNISILNNNQHVTIKEFNDIHTDNLVLDVRPDLEFQMCNLPGTVNFPYSKIEKQENFYQLKKILEESISKGKKKGID